MNQRVNDQGTAGLPGESEYVYCLFQQPWWLEAVAPGKWNAITVEENGSVVARLPYIVKKRFGLVAVTQPALTRSMGPWLHDHTAGHRDQLARQKHLMYALIDQLPRFDFFRQAFCPEITNWQPFYWRGFQQTTLYTYRIDDLTDLDQLWRRFDSNARQNIRKAEKQVTVRDDLGIDKLIEVARRTYARKKQRFPLDEAMIRRIDTACAQRGAHRLLFAEDSRGHVHAALLLVYDKSIAYYLIGGIDPECASSGAMTLLMWHAIQFSAGVTRIFDFEGSMDENIERFFRKFATKQTPYFLVTKLDRRLRLLARLREIP